MPLNTQVLRRLDSYRRTEVHPLREADIIEAIGLLLEADNLYDALRLKLLDAALWAYTENAGVSPHPKYNIRFVSAGAKDLDRPASLNHEHVWSRRFLKDKLLAGRPWDRGELSDFLRGHAVACTVTTMEHAALGNANAEGWTRYATARVPVWDRVEGAYLDLATPQPLDAERTAVPPTPEAPGQEWDLPAIIDARSQVAEHHHELNRIAKFSSAVAVVATRRSGELSDYYRIHDTQLPEPTRAVAYPHWSGKVDFALEWTDVSSDLRAAGAKELAKPTYSVTIKIVDRTSRRAAEELLFLALSKLREE